MEIAEIYSHLFFLQNSVKLTQLVLNPSVCKSVCCFHEIFFQVRVKFANFHTVEWISVKTSMRGRMKNFFLFRCCVFFQTAKETDLNSAYFSAAKVFSLFAQCRNLRIFQSLNFYVKLIFTYLELFTSSKGSF